MVDDNIRTIIRPTPEALSHADPTLFEMIRYIRHFLDRHDPNEIAHNASLVYLAILTAFKDVRLLELAWVPSLTLDIGDREFEIVISEHVANHNTTTMEVEEESPTTSTSDDLLTVEQMGLNASPYSAKDFAPKKGRASKVIALLDTLIHRSGQYQEIRYTTASIPPLASESQAKAEGSKISANKLFECLLDEISRLDGLQFQADKMSVAINRCYWNIGVSYREFCKTLLVSREGSRHPRTMEKEAFATLCATPRMAKSIEKTKARARLQKRLQRARKFVVLVDIFGEQVLHWVPEISVSRLDHVRLEDLQRIATGSIEQKRVQAIKAKSLGLLLNSAVPVKGSN